MANQFIIEGGHPLFGEITVSGMKNAALPILFATVLVKGTAVIENVPDVSDIDTTLKILSVMGATVERKAPNTVSINTEKLVSGVAPYELVKMLRASSYLLGAELGRFHKANVGYPGGCDFGTRPLDLHLKGFRALGATVDTDGGYIKMAAPQGLHGSSVYFDIASVGATVNIILASVLADGMTTIENAAREPHIVDLANFLNFCGAKISGAGTGVIRIKGVKELHACEYSLIPDMIEAGTYMVAAAATCGKITLKSVIPKHVEAISAKLVEMGVSVEEGDEEITVTGTRNLQNANIQTLCYPGFPTDMQPQFAVLLCLANGISSIQEGIWKNRFRYTGELSRMGATIMVEPPSATVIGVQHLTGAPVEASDLRAGAALVIAGLSADGVTEISGIDFIKRGYDRLVEKLTLLGATIKET